MGSRQLTAEEVSHGRNDNMEIKTRWLYTSGLAFIVINHIVDQIAPNIGMAGLPTSVLMVVALLLLAARFLSVALYCRVSKVMIALTAVALSVASWILSGQSYLLTATFLLLGIGNMNIKGVLRVVSATVLLLIVFLGLL